MAGQCVCVASTPPPRGSGREPTYVNGRRACGAEGQRNSAPVLLFLCESELGLQEAKAGHGSSWLHTTGGRAMINDTKHDTQVIRPPPPRRRRDGVPAAAAKTTHFFPRTRFARGPCMGA